MVCAHSHWHSPLGMGSTVLTFYLVSCVLEYYFWLLSQLTLDLFFQPLSATVWQVDVMGGDVV